MVDLNEPAGWGVIPFKDMKEEILNFDYSLPPYPHIYPDISEMNRVYPRNSELQNISETDLGLCFYMFLTEQNM